MMTDPIADFLTRIRNANSVSKDRLEVPANKTKAAICKVLKEEGYIRSFKIIVKEKNDIRLKVLLKDDAIRGIERVSKPGLRRYSGYKDMPRVLSGLGISVLSTSKGVMSSRHARKEKLGGEVLCNVW